MALKPSASPITFNNTTTPVCSGEIYADEITFSEILQNFDRLEFSNAKLRTLPSPTGALPLIVQGFGNIPIQLVTTCTGDLPRPLVPDDAEILNIKQRFNILRYTIKGAASNQIDVDNLFSVWQEHAVRLNAFDLYLGELQMDLSYNYFIGTLQAETFSFLTTTGLSLTGNALEGSLYNMLISEFTADVEYEAPLNDGSGNSTLLYGFSMTVENRTISSQGFPGI